MTTPNHIIINCETGEREIVPFTEEQIAVAEAAQVRWQEILVEQEAEAEKIKTLKTSAKAKLIAGEPLTEDEASVLVI
jgi:hypothetical protein